MKEENNLQEIPIIWEQDAQAYARKAADVLKSFGLADENTILMVRQGFKDQDDTPSPPQTDKSGEKGKEKSISGC